MEEKGFPQVSALSTPYIPNTSVFLTGSRFPNPSLETPKAWTRILKPT